MSESAAVLPFGVVILAAGRSMRMGQPKLLLPWGETTILGRLVADWSSLEARQIAVVCGAADAGLQAELDRLSFPVGNRIINPDPGAEMFSSIQCAARWPRWDAMVTHWAIALGDQPHLRTETLRALMTFARKSPDQVCQPGWGGRPCHPVVLPRAMFGRLAASPAETLREFLRPFAGSTRIIDSDDSGLDLDIDSPADYERALRMARSGS